jgi:GR25 family glycosyltransferase involved in LPS biosynthesis
MSRTLADLPVYVINLDRRPDRWQFIRGMLMANGFHDIHRISAVDGRTLGAAKINQLVTPQGRETFKRERKRHEELGSLGAVGCYLSHVDAWGIIKQSGRPGIVVEDDATLIPSFQQSSVFKQPDLMCKPYDLVLLGYAKLRDDEMTLREDKDAIVPFRSMFFGTHFYYITPQGARKLLEIALPMEIQLDAWMGMQMSQEKVKTGVHFPNLSWQLPDDTDIQTSCVGCDDDGHNAVFSVIAFFLIVIVVLSGCVWFCKR